LGATFYVRTEQPADAVIAALPRLVARVDASLPVMEPQTLSSQARRNVREDRLLTTLAATLAVVATLLAAIGIYGVLSYMVAHRAREIGLRLALGAEPSGVRRMVLKQVGWMLLVGVPAGLGAAVLIGNVARSMLFGIGSTDASATIVAAVLLTTVVLVASYWPARRASRVDPMAALRAE
jgi:ABC-type antimicrobial peptide transport system permease subunit